MDQWFRTIVGPIAVIAILSALYVAGPVIEPVIGAIFIIALTWPLQVRLQSKLPQLVALAIVISLTVVVFFVFSSVVAWGFGRIGRSLVANIQYFQALYEQTAAWLENHGIVIAGMWSEHFDVRWLVRTLQGISGHVNTTISFWLVVVVYVILGLLEVDVVARKIPALLSATSARIILDGSAITAAKFRRYMLIRTLMSVATGVFVWGLAAISGLQLATEWGVIAFALNYIPFIGPFIATVFPTLFALGQFASWQSAFAIFACLNVIQFVIGSYIEPRVAGNALSMSPFLVLFSVFFWTFFWGLFGAFIGVPITIALLTFCAQNPASKWIADLLGGPGEADIVKQT
jgi:AI-2 transport protein TqsA